MLPAIVKLLIHSHPSKQEAWRTAALFIPEVHICNAQALGREGAA